MCRYIKKIFGHFEPKKKNSPGLEHVNIPTIQDQVQASDVTSLERGEQQYTVTQYVPYADTMDTNNLKTIDNCKAWHNS